MQKCYTVDEFIALTQSEPNKWINYCEVLLTAHGDIILARPSHQQACIQYVAEKEDTSVSDIEDFLRREWLSPLEFYAGLYGLAGLRYDYIMCDVSGLTCAQATSLAALQEYGLVSRTAATIVTNEWGTYKARLEYMEATKK